MHFSIDALFKLCLENGDDLLDRNKLYKQDIFIWFECFKTTGYVLQLQSETNTTLFIVENKTKEQIHFVKKILVS